MRTPKAFITSFSVTAVTALAVGLVVVNQAAADNDTPPAATPTSSVIEAEPAEAIEAVEADKLTEEDQTFMAEMERWTVGGAVAPTEIDGLWLTEVSEHTTTGAVVAHAQSCATVDDSAVRPQDMVQYSYVEESAPTRIDLVVSDWAVAYAGLESIIEDTGHCRRAAGWSVAEGANSDSGYVLLTNGTDYAAVGGAGGRLFAVTVTGLPAEASRERAMSTVRLVAEGEHALDTFSRDEHVC